MELLKKIIGNKKSKNKRKKKKKILKEDFQF